ncbi:calcium-binding protein [Sulfitobacter guttiformis]|uniref:Hemolysin type calcium-binding protein n=1 Tax=Sulfitobacter guttiformis TaxID=74349 RepID=A0A420DN09_9RHOB|nr:calcium-binding protein [Sulfitobacter guttiformis]KIN72922.1 Type I secretion target repeat protein [Sulfitobacter guttiformis KCTC 32187]RKE95611.1 hemolysin type calcium-binding protein [Sulfitobacter guttiformis]
MLLLLSFALPLAILGFGLNGDDDEEEVVEQEGTEEGDRLEGTEGSDFIDGLEGDDVMNGRAGNDTIFGRDGDDILQGEDGDDMLCSGDGDDFVTGNVGQDLIEGQGGDDFVSGDYGFDTVNGDEGNDTVVGGRGGDMVNGGEGDDLVFGGILEGLPLNLDQMTALRDGASMYDVTDGIDMRDDSVGNTLSGGAGDDNLILGSGDIADGNEGADTFHIMSEQNGTMAPTIVNFELDTDALTIIVDDVDTDLEVSVTDEAGDSVIRLGDNVLARVTGTAGSITAADVTLISEAEVETLFDPNPVVIAPAVAPAATVS